MNSKGETFAELLDRELYGRGHDAMVRLTEELAESGSDLSQQQIYRTLNAWRNEVRQGLTFDLACRVVAACPRLLDHVAGLGNMVVVEASHAQPPSAETLLRATTAYQQDEASSVATILDASADGIITVEEAEEIERELRSDETRIAAIRRMIAQLRDQTKTSGSPAGNQKPATRK